MSEPNLSEWYKKHSPVSRQARSRSNAQGLLRQNSVFRTEALLCKIYEDNVLGKLPDARYAVLDAQYAKEQAALTAEIATLEKAVGDYEKHE